MKASIYSISAAVKGALYVSAFFAASLFSQVAVAQQRLETPIRLKIEDGKTDDVSVVLKNLTTGETNSVKGEAKFSLSLKLNCDYIISFNKPGYVTKKIQVTTNIPADRALQGLYPFPFDVYLFKQYDGVNIIVFNQPVGKISYNRDMDEFDYDTDYTKQIQSQIQEAEEQTKQQALVEQEKSKDLEKEQARLKKVADAEAKEGAKARAAEEKKAAVEAKAAEEAKQQAEKLAMQEKQREMKAQQEAEKKARLEARAAEEQKRKQEARAASESVAPRSGAAGSESIAVRAGNAGEEPAPDPRTGAAGDEPLAVVVQAESAGDPPPPDGYMGEGKDQLVISNANGYLFAEPGPEKAKPFVFQESRSVSNQESVVLNPVVAAENTYEVLPDVSVEEISEINRVITRVTVRRPEYEIVYRRVVYRWGGVYFFKNDRSISESLYLMATAAR